MIKKIIGCTSLLLMCGSVAVAATTTTNDGTVVVDGTPIMVNTIPISTEYAQGNWNGFYLGAGLGYAFGNIATTLKGNVPGTSASKTVSDGFSAPHPVGIAGYSHTFDRFYLGGELDIGGYVGGDASNTAHNSFATGSASASPTWSVTPSVLLGGLLSPQWLVYGRLGVPMVGMDSSQSVVGTGGDAFGHSTNNAFTAGVLGGLGLGYSFNPHVNLRAEYDYSRLWGPSSSQTYLSNSVSTKSSLETSANEVLMSVSYVF